ncbi:MAG: tripartite tricarboxylate transporter TctB family protein [Dethiobacteria bacterium]
MDGKNERIQRYFIELIFPVLCIGFVVYYYINTRSLHHYSTIYPKIIIVLLLLCIAWEVVMKVQKWRKEGLSKQPIWVEDNLKAVVVFLSTILFVILFTYVGFCVSLFLYMGFMAYYLGNKNIIGVLTFAICSSIIFYVVFVYLLKLPMPKGILF